MPVGRYETSLAICNQASIEMGQKAITALFASADPNVVLLRTLLNSCGRELAMMRQWRHLLKDASITAAAAVAPALYGVNALPTDYDYAINDTFWDTSTSEPLTGPANEVIWNFQVAIASGPIPPLFRVEGNSLWLYPDKAGDTITFKYLSLWWVKASGQASPNLSASTADTDTIYFHPLLITRLLKLRWLQARGLDSAAAGVDVERTYQMVAGLEKPAPVLYLSQTMPNTELI